MLSREEVQKKAAMVADGKPISSFHSQGVNAVDIARIQAASDTMKRTREMVNKRTSRRGGYKKSRSTRRRRPTKTNRKKRSSSRKSSMFKLF